MFTKSKRTFTLFAITTAACLCCLTLAFADHNGKTHGGKDKPGGGDLPSFVVVDLGGPLGGARKINDFGELAGAIDHHATYWQVDTSGNVQTIALPEIAGFRSRAEDINNLAELVGAEAFQNESGQIIERALLWRVTDSGVSMVELPPLPGDNDSHANSISDSGLIAGYSTAYDADGNFLGRSAVIWQVDDQNNVHTFELDRGDSNSNGNVTAVDVSNFGLVVGYEGVIWKLQFDAADLVVGASAPNPLSTLGGTKIGVGSIKDFGKVTGSAETADGEIHAVVWTIDADGIQTAITDLGVLPGKESAGSGDINSSAQAIGNSTAITSKRGIVQLETAPFLWQNGQMADLNDLIVDNGGFNELNRALGINEAGWICGVGLVKRGGGDSRAYVAIPLP